MQTTSSKLPYELLIGWRYTRAGRVAGRNGFISFISGVSMLGIALGVAALIIVLSVMNGFQKEVRDRMLAVVSHIELLAPNSEGFSDVNALMAQAKQNTEVVAAAPLCHNKPCWPVVKICAARWCAALTPNPKHR